MDAPSSFHTPYMRRLSPYVTRALLRTPITANGVTWLMVPSGLLGAAALTIPGLLATVER